MLRGAKHQATQDRAVRQFSLPQIDEARSPFGRRDARLPKRLFAALHDLLLTASTE
jgi:hypothetical protein